MRDLEQWRSEIRGAWRLMQLTLGTSVVGIAISILTIIALLSGVVHPATVAFR